MCSTATLAATLDSIGDIYDGVAVVALDHPRVREAINGLVERGVTVVTLVSDVPGSKRVALCRHRQFLRRAHRREPDGTFLGDSKGEVGLIAGSLSLRDHIERQFGFEQIMAHEFPHLAILPVLRSARRLAARRGGHGAIACTSIQISSASTMSARGTRGIVTALEKAGRQRQVIFIAHELTDHARSALIKGTIDAIINQDAGP